MRDAQHLMPLCQLTHPRANSVSNFAADVSVDFVEYEQRHFILRSQGGFDRQHQP